MNIIKRWYGPHGGPNVPNEGTNSAIAHPPLPALSLLKHKPNHALHSQGEAQAT